ncbi:MAG: carbon monoxide dehydrogenase, partial [Desulforhabdus sp.]|nr:carbon monoxide dehydrogenase [Desulforhabdus sp.]
MNDLYASRTIARDSQLLLKKAEQDLLETVWDRNQSQLTNSGYSEMGLSCRICTMGPCRNDPFGEGP